MKIGSIVWGVKDIDRAVRFWSEALHFCASENWASGPEEGDGIRAFLSNDSGEQTTTWNFQTAQQ